MNRPERLSARIRSAFSSMPEKPIEVEMHMSAETLARIDDMLRGYPQEWREKAKLVINESVNEAVVVYVLEVDDADPYTQPITTIHAAHWYQELT